MKITAPVKHDVNVTSMPDRGIFDGVWFGNQEPPFAADNLT
jgi:hypothetical protein